MKKKLLAMLLAAVMMMAMLPTTALASDAHVNPNSLSYKVEKDNTVTITGCPKTATGTLDIPATIEGLPVRKIKSDAFRDCKNITYATIPNGVTEIGSAAFRGCSSLLGVSIPSTVTTIGSSAFRYCTSLISVSIPSGVTAISDYLFEDCTNLQQVTIPNTVTSIGGDSFHNCKSLTSITIPSSVTIIYIEAFRGCTALKTVSIPASVKELGYYVFAGCTSLTSASLANGLRVIKGYTFLDCTSLKSITIPSSVTELGWNAFNGCTALTTATLNGTYTKLTGQDIFNKCGSLETLIINAPLTSFGDYTMFGGCTSLKTIYLPGTLYDIKDSTFRQCSALSDIYFNGSAYDWAGVGIGKNNEYLKAAKVHYVPFRDVAPGSWYYDSVDYVVEHGLMNGNGSTTFSPSVNLSRGMITTILARVEGVPTDGGSTWYQKGMDWAKAEGISDGQAPERDITREELAVMLWRYAGEPSARVSILNSYSDSSSIHNWAGFREAMAWAVENSIIQGNGDKVNPRNTATRAEAATMIMRFCEKLGK